MKPQNASFQRRAEDHYTQLARMNDEVRKSGGEERDKGKQIETRKRLQPLYDHLSRALNHKNQVVEA